MREEIRELQQTLNLTVAYVTHDQEEALAVSDRIIVMSNSRIAQEGTPRQLYEEPADAFVADFIGDANMVDVTVKSVADGRAAVAIGPASVSLLARGLQPGPAKAAIRPQSLLVSRHESQGALPGNVRKCAYLGDHLDLMIETSVGEALRHQPRCRRHAGAGHAGLALLRQLGRDPGALSAWARSPASKVPNLPE